MKNFKGIILSEHTSQLTTLRHFPKIFSMIHIPLKPIASADCDTTLFLVVFSFFEKTTYCCRARRLSVRPSVCPSVRPSVRLSVCGNNFFSR